MCSNFQTIHDSVRKARETAAALELGVYSATVERAGGIHMFTLGAESAS